MDSINLRRKVSISQSFTPSLMIITAAFVLGAVFTILFREAIMDDIMSILQSAGLIGWICLATLIFADTACIVMPAARVLSTLFAAAFGAMTLAMSYLHASLKLFSSEFFVFAAVIFLFSVAITYVSDRIFALSPKLRTFIRSDHKLRYEINVFNAVSVALMLAAIISAAVFIL